MLNPPVHHDPLLWEMSVFAYHNPWFRLLVAWAYMCHGHQWQVIEKCRESAEILQFERKVS